MIKIAVILFSLLLCYGCGNNFLNTASSSSYNEEFVFSTTEKAYAALNGMHRAMVMQYDKNQYYGGYPSILILNEMLGDDVVLTTNGNSYWANEYRWQGHRSAIGIFPFFAYHFFYKLIANANMILENIDQATGSEGEKHMIKGQVLAYRALSYFWLVQFYGKRYDATRDNTQPAVPLILYSTDDKLPRSSVKEVYRQILADLQNAIVHLEHPSNNFVRSAKHHFTPAVVKGLYARVALTMQDWESAKTYASQAITDSDCTWMSAQEYTSGFNDATNPEWLWAFEQSPEQSTYYHGFMAFMSYNFTSSSVKTNPKAISSKLYEQIPEQDIRKGLWDPTGKAFSLPAVFTKKPYMNCKFKVANPSSSVADIPFMRLAELYLILAEAKARLNEADAADILYSLVSTRNPDYQRSSATGTTLLEEILLQRRIELWGEGFRFTDLKRLNQRLDRNHSNHIQNLCRILTMEAGDPAWQFMLPQKELKANEWITQNP